MQVSFWNNQIFKKWPLKYKFKNVENFTFYSCFWISLQIHIWDKCCHLVFGEAFVYITQNTSAIFWMNIFHLFVFEGLLK